MNIKPSATLAISALIKEKKAHGEEVFDLSVGEIIGIKNQQVIDAVKNKLAESFVWQYPAIFGLKELREAVANWHNQEYQTSYSAENVLVTAGGKFAIYILLQMLLKKGEDVLIPKPYWVSYPEIVKIFGGMPKFISTTKKDGWKITVKDLEKVWTPKTKILILNSINNPTGAIYDEIELKEILNWTEKKKIVVISDEVYSSLIYDRKQKYFSCGAVKTNSHVVVVQSCSKNFAMSGWRVGFILGSVDIIKNVSVLQSQSITGVASVCQWAVLTAVRSWEDTKKSIYDQVIRRRDELVKSFREFCDIKISPPSAGLYLFISLKELGVKNNNSADFAQNLLSKSNVTVVPGKAFGEEGYLRLSFGGAETEIREGVKKLALFIKNHNELILSFC